MGHEGGEHPVVGASPKRVVVLAHPVELERALINLCKNASEALPGSGGEICLRLKLNELDVHPSGLQNGHVRLEFDQFTAGVRALARLATA